VGAGSAGAVVANRLSKNNKVLLLEAGSEPLYLNSIPGLAANMVGQPLVDWKYFTVPQKHSMLSMNEQVTQAVAARIKSLIINDFYSALRAPLAILLATG